MIVVNSNYISGAEYNTMSLVSSTAYCTGMQNPLLKLEEYMEKTKELAISRMIKKAEAMGADGIINVSFTATQNHQQYSVLVSGTAVKFK